MLRGGVAPARTKGTCVARLAALAPLVVLCLRCTVDSQLAALSALLLFPQRIGNPLAAGKKMRNKFFHGMTIASLATNLADVHRLLLYELHATQSMDGLVEQRVYEGQARRATHFARRRSPGYV
jgi:hypothetical protein